MATTKSNGLKSVGTKSAKKNQKVDNTMSFWEFMDKIDFQKTIDESNHSDLVDILSREFHFGLPNKKSVRETANKLVFEKLSDYTNTEIGLSRNLLLAKAILVLEYGERARSRIVNDEDTDLNGMTIEAIVSYCANRLSAVSETEK